uniref:G_PROTEIN_RECEP_F1_2 domain-containing protein n=1 Tax=Elaeophora elaphi TaxID=1147741 RepID=A0A0R3RFM1_9BILA
MDDNPCSNLTYPTTNITEYVFLTLGERCLPYSIVLPTVIFYIFIFVAGIFGNVCTCAVIVKCSFMHNTTNYYLFSLAISDLLILLVGLPMELYDVLGSTYPYKFGTVVCKVRAFLVEFTSYASILIIAAFTMERWLAICFPLQILNASPISRASKVIPAAWSIAFIAALPMAFVVKVNRLALPLSAINSSWVHLVSNDGQTIINTDFCAMDVNNPRAQKFLIYFAFTIFFLLPGEKTLDFFSEKLIRAIGFIHF